MQALKKGDLTVIAEVEMGTGFLVRAFGLMGRKTLPPGRGLFLAPCSTVHTSFMRFAIDLLFVDRENRIVRIVRNVKPWRFAGGGPGAYAVVEVATGWLPQDTLRVGDQLDFG